MEEKKELSESSKTAKFHSETIKGLVILFYKNLLVYSPIRFTNAYMIARTLANRFKKKKYVDELDGIYTKSGTIGYPLGLIQVISFRDIRLGKNTGKSYNYGYQTKNVKLGDMIVALDQSMLRIMDIFTLICVENDIDTTFALPIFEGMTLEKGAL